MQEVRCRWDEALHLICQGGCEDVWVVAWGRHSYFYLSTSFKPVYSIVLVPVVSGLDTPSKIFRSTTVGAEVREHGGFLFNKNVEMKLPPSGKGIS